ncbi:hypothetical protein KC19_4G018000 [Ceratodon purpureus]|uniref:D-2-hydroxyglutarate dehydrogenase n=1 Tax=Ceratodon purpureus TaxID=3225 RepID=A0A8T0I4F1_CERPU|nr:hypothetical protein KC19_4G018000 [Ceratodon purpureus]
MAPAKRAVDVLVRARLLTGGAWSQSRHYSGRKLVSQEEQLVSHRPLYNDQDRNMSSKSAPVESGLRCSLFESYMRHQVRRFAVSTKSSGNASAVKSSRFDKLKEPDVKFFKSAVGEKGVIMDKDELAVANIDWMHKYQGHSQILLRPQTTRQVSEILRYCNSRNLAVVPQGGNTGLVGGGVPVHDEVIMNLGALNKIISFDEVSGILVCESGCILENLDNYIGNKGFTMPLDLGAKGSCQIGGNVSTNAGGLRLLRYGSLHGNVLGLEVVLADGTVVDMLGTLIKDNTGYDMKQLFIGGEGTLGVVTKVSILVPAKLGSVNTAFLACEDYESCQNVLKEAKMQLGEILSAFEFIDRAALDMALTHLSGTRDPLPQSWKNFYLLIETTGSDEAHDKEKLHRFLESTMEKGFVADGVVAQGSTQADSFWQIREGISEAIGKAGAVYKYDFSLPPKYFYKIVEDLRGRLGSAAVVLGYGHLGDGNVHLNVSAPEYDNELLEKIEPYVFEWVAKHKGSVSAEHGIGFMKPHALHYSKSTEAIMLMEKFKSLLDPKGILNPYKVLPNASKSTPNPNAAAARTLEAAEVF